MNTVNHTQPSHQTNAQNVATNTPTKPPPVAQMGSRRCHNLQMYSRGLINNLLGGFVTTTASFLVSTASSSQSRDNPEYINNFLSVANVGISLAYVGMIIHHGHLIKKYIVPEVIRISNAPDTTARTESAVKDCNV